MEHTPSSTEKRMKSTYGTVEVQPLFRRQTKRTRVRIRHDSQQTHQWTDNVIKCLIVALEAQRHWKIGVVIVGEMIVGSHDFAKIQKWGILGRRARFMEQKILCCTFCTEGHVESPNFLLGGGRISHNRSQAGGRIPPKDRTYGTSTFSTGRKFRQMFNTNPRGAGEVSIEIIQ